MSVVRRVWSFALSVAWIPLAIGLASAQAEDTAPRTQPLPSTLFETIQPRLVLLDYWMTGPGGEPLCDVNDDELTLRVDGKPWPIESVDVLESEFDRGSSRGVEETRAREVSRPRHIAFFVDVSQISWPARREALDLVAEWLRRSFRAGDRVSVVIAGAQVHLIADGAQDADKVLADLGVALDDDQVHESFANARDDRVAACKYCCNSCCLEGIREEQEYARRSWARLLHLLRSLDGSTLDTSVVYVHEIALVTTEMLFRCQTDRDSEPLLTLAEITAEASLRNVMIHTAMVGSTVRAGRADAIHVGANFHERTGGSYNREPAQLPAVLDSIGPLPACVVRVGFRPPKSRQGRIHWAKLEAPGVVVPRTRAFRVRSVADIWGERAARALREPEAHEQIPLCAAIVPVGRTRRAWVVEARLALPLRGLLAQREASGSLRTHWEIAAVIEDPGSTTAWGYEGSREAFAESEDARHRTWVEHRARLVTKSPLLALHAMAGDRTTWDMGATTARLELGGDDGPMLAAPVVFVRVARTEPSTFVFEGTSEEGPAAFVSALEALDDDYVPASCVTTRKIREARVATLACDERSSRTFRGDVQRVLMRAGRPIARLASVEEFSQRGCTLFIDDLVVPDGLELSAEFEVAAIYDRPGGERLIARSPLGDGALSSPAAATPDTDSALHHSPESPR